VKWARHVVELAKKGEFEASRAYLGAIFDLRRAGGPKEILTLDQAPSKVVESIEAKRAESVRVAKGHLPALRQAWDDVGRYSWCPQDLQREILRIRDKLQFYVDVEGKKWNPSEGVMKPTRRNADDNLRSLERYHLDHLDDGVGLQKLVRGLTRSHGVTEALPQLARIWAENDVEPDAGDFSAVAIALMPTGDYEPEDMDAVLAAVNTWALEFELEAVAEDDYDQDERNPEWRARRYHNISPGGVAPEGSWYTPLGRLLTVFRWADPRHGKYPNAWALWVKDVLPPEPVDETDEERLSSTLMAWATVLAHGARIRMSRWALDEILTAARRIALTLDPATVLKEGNSVVNVMTASGGTKILTKKQVEGLIGGKAKMIAEESGSFGVERWQSTNKNELNVHEFVDVDRGLDDILAGRLRSLFQITPYPFHVKESELLAWSDERAGTLTLEWVGNKRSDEVFQGDGVTIAHWTNEPAFIEDDEEGEPVYDDVGDLGSLVQDGFLNPQDWRGSAMNYCESVGWLEIDE
jgi:hypothetical protein